MENVSVFEKEHTVCLLEAVVLRVLVFVTSWEQLQEIKPGSNEVKYHFCGSGGFGAKCELKIG